MSQSASIAGLSFSGADVKAYATIPYMFFKGAYDRDGGARHPGLVRIKDLQTLSVSIYRDVSPVRAIGYRNVRGHTRGTRTIAGSLIFAVIDEHPLRKLLDTWIYEYSYDTGYWDGHNFPDQIPPFNIHLVYSAELPARITPEENASRRVPFPTWGTLTIFGVTLTNDGMVTSIDDLLTENTYQYVARDMHIFEGYRNSRDPKHSYRTSTNRSGHTNIADDERLNALLGATRLQSGDLSAVQRQALENEISYTFERAREHIAVQNPGFASGRERAEAALPARRPDRGGGGG